MAMHRKAEFELRQSPSATEQLGVAKLLVVIAVAVAGRLDVRAEGCGKIWIG